LKNTKDKDWSKVSLPFISIGYESHLTPLQLLTFYNAVANNGKMVQPLFVKEISNKGHVVKSFPTSDC
jgi:cell division protein FtsI (penicillin-binding protein 3)